ncbi:MAG: HPF/RaiA family ribosome-associated protein [Myxococcaceae bacterium]|nr:HPF/RaiA family ribosome-associated protein [Myxococcaceae bacterium]
MATKRVNLRTSKGIELDTDTREHVDERMQRQLKKLGDRAMRATVRFEDLNGPRGGVDTVCRVKVVLAGLHSIVTEARGSEPREAFDLAAGRAQRAAVRLLEAARSVRRRAV